MFSWIKARNRRKRNAHIFYGSIVALSRAPALYSDIGVPDTVEVRFEILVLHMFALLERLGLETNADEKLSQELVNLFFSDMDTTSRELGVGDLKVPKKMRVIAAVYEERIATYRNVFSKSDMDLLAAEFEKNIFIGDSASQQAAKRLAGYTQTLRAKLADASLAAIIDKNFSSMNDFWTKQHNT